MKKIISLFSFILAFAVLAQAETVNYYVATTGNDANDGLTSENALATVDSAIAYIHDDFAGGTNNDFTINIGEGTFNAAGIAISNDSLAFTLSVVGEGADKTIITAHVDSTDVPNKYLFKQFTAVNSNVSINLSQLKVSNYGFNNNNYGAIFYNYNGSAANVSFSIDNCIVEKIFSNLGGIFGTNQPTTSFTLTNTYLSDVTTHCHNNRFHSPILAAGTGAITVNNCVFNNFVRDHNTSGQQVNSRWGTVIGATNGKTNTVAMSLSFVNNTIINDSLINGTKMNNDQSAIFLTSATEVSVNPTVTIANNIFITGNQTFTGSSEATKNYSAIYVNPDGQPITWENSSNNVMNSQVGFIEDNNTIDATLEYTSTEIAFVMDGDFPEVMTADNGLMYVQAEGTAIVDAALASVAPMYDIAGFERSATPTIGAYEGEQTTAISEISSPIAGLYPNPATDIVNVRGDVAQLAIYSISGQSIGTYSVVNKQVNVSQLAQGAYIVSSINTEGVSIQTSQLIKR